MEIDFSYFLLAGVQDAKGHAETRSETSGAFPGSRPPDALTAIVTESMSDFLSVASAAVRGGRGTASAARV